MTDQPLRDPSIAKFITRWQRSEASERSNYGMFLTELCSILGVPVPDPATKNNAENAYVFERSVTFQNGDGTTSAGFIDLYKRECFVLEAKQGVEKDLAERPFSEAGLKERKRSRKGTATRQTPAWDDSMLRARGQAEQYARALPHAEGRPPFLIVVDVGHSIELYSEFSRTGGAYIPFPDPRTHRILITQLEDPAQREKLRGVWTDPLSLDPSRRSARVTREIAEKLAELARKFESDHAPQVVASFLMRCIFTMFAEDVGLLPKRCIHELLESLRGDPSKFTPMLEELWKSMKTGGFSTVLRENVLRFNGGLFEDPTALSLNSDQLELLIEAAKSDWREVEPAIFGTLLERALDPVERHKLGAHYTPRAYVERLVLPTVIEPLRGEWNAVLAAAVTLAHGGEQEMAVAEAQAFHQRLCEVRVLDPACGSGNFLYVTLEHLKRLEGEVLNFIESLGEMQIVMESRGLSVDPHQLLGIEVNPRAAAITELVLWIGYLQWHFRTKGEVTPPQPIIKNFKNIECRDAVLAWDRIEPVMGEEGQPVTRWDGRTMKTHPVTGEEVPDDTERVAVVRYVNPRKAEWPEADYVVGNPPFIGNWRMRSALGDGYAEAIRGAHVDLAESCDYVMYWWDKAAHLLREGPLRRFGFIATNSLRQTFNRKILDKHLTAKDPVSLVFAIPDHPWVDAEQGAAVRISMTVAEAGSLDGMLFRVVHESEGDSEGADVELSGRGGKVFSDLTIGANVAGVRELQSNRELSCPGVKLHGAGFIVTPDEAKNLGLGRIKGLENHIREYRNGKDITARPRGVMVVDLFGLEAHEVRDRFPEVYQWIAERVKPERDMNNRASYRDNWWMFGEPRRNFRPALKGRARANYTLSSWGGPPRFCFDA